MWNGDTQEKEVLIGHLGERMTKMSIVKIGDLMEIGVVQEVHQMEVILTVGVIVDGVMRETPDIPMEIVVLAMTKMTTRKVLATLRVPMIDLEKRLRFKGLRTAGFPNQGSQIVALQTFRKKQMVLVLLYGQ